jgi:hypothetical protein
MLLTGNASLDRLASNSAVQQSPPILPNCLVILPVSFRVTNSVKLNVISKRWIEYLNAENLSWAELGQLDSITECTLGVK